PADAGMPTLPWVDDEAFNPGYVHRGIPLLPKQGDRQPWRHTQDYWADSTELPAADLDDGLDYAGFRPGGRGVARRGKFPMLYPPPRVAAEAFYGDGPMALELNDEVVDTPPRDSASVLLLRDAANGAGIEIFMVRRHQKSDVLGGAYVFPGGKVDEADAAAITEAALVERLHQRLGEPSLSREKAAAVFAAAARETVEECHVTVGVADLVPFTRWITPRTPSLQRKRFDTRFFAAPLPAGAEAVHDNHEAVASVWFAPRQ